MLHYKLFENIFTIFTLSESFLKAVFEFRAYISPLLSPNLPESIFPNNSDTISNVKGEINPRRAASELHSSGAEVSRLSLTC